MGVIEYIIGGLLIVASVLLIIVVSAQNPSGSGISSAIMGGDSSQAGRVNERSNEAKMSRLIKALAVVFFIAALAGSLLTILK